MLIRSFLSLSLLLASHTYAGKFIELTRFGDNPGRLNAQLYVPTSTSNKLLVFLHGCTQQGKAFVIETALQAFAERHNLLLLVPQQRRMNHINLCYNWYSKTDAMGEGESRSMLSMIKTLKQQYPINSVGIVGISAGAAMITPLLIQKPELFSYVAIVASPAYDCADGIFSGLSCMLKGPKNIDSMIDAIKKQWPEKTPIPQISIWQGGEDKVVVPANAELLANQWLHTAKQPLSKQQLQSPAYQQTQWRNQQGELLLSHVLINKMGHALPVDLNKAELPKFSFVTEISITEFIEKHWQGFVNPADNL